MFLIECLELVLSCKEKKNQLQYCVSLVLLSREADHAGKKVSPSNFSSRCPLNQEMPTLMRTTAVGRGCKTETQNKVRFIVNFAVHTRHGAVKFSSRLASYQIYNPEIESIDKIYHAK